MPELKYQIVQADVAGCPALPGQYNDPTEAAKFAKQLGKERGEKLIVKLVINDEWKKREKTRFNEGTYRPLPWGGMDWWIHPTTAAMWRDHYAHPSVEKAGWIAYTKTAEDGMKDKQTIVRVGSYLKQFSRMMNYYGIEERRMVNMFAEIYGPLDVKFATTEDEIISVYDHGPETCMRDRQWPNNRNPAYVYAAGDLQIAYLGDLDNPTARTLVWPDKKTHSRVYGDIAKLTRGLERMGYKWGAPVGARIKKVAVQEVNFNPNRGVPTRCFIAPYIDKKNQRGGGHLGVIDKGEHLEICDEGLPGSHHCGGCDGYTSYYVPRQDEFPTFTCERCDTPGHRELITVLSDAEDGDEMSWCATCVNREAFHCGYSGNWFTQEDNDSSEVDGNYWHNYYVEMYAGRCEETGYLTNSENLRTVHYADGSSKQVSRDWANDKGMFQSFLSKRNFLRDQQAIFRNIDSRLHYVGKSELKYHAFTCTECGNHSALSLRNQPYGDDRLVCYDCMPGLLKPHKEPSRFAPIGGGGIGGYVSAADLYKVNF